MTKEERNKIREYYCDHFLSEVKVVLNLPKKFKFVNSDITKKIEYTTDQLHKLKALCDENKKLRDIFNSKNIAARLTPDWCFSVHFNIKFD